jgi:hypothetical protein
MYCLRRGFDPAIEYGDLSERRVSIALEGDATSSLRRTRDGRAVREAPTGSSDSREPPEGGCYGALTITGTCGCTIGYRSRDSPGEF